MASKSDWQVKVAQLKARPDNKHCADCLAQETEWASTNLGVFLCINCSGVHRSLGVHVSTVRSVQLDEWDENFFNEMNNKGNVRANAYWECNLFPFEKPLAQDPYFFRKKFILDKYVNKRYIPSENNTQMKIEREFNIDLLSKRGNLTKQGGQHKTWKKRFCVLNENVVSYFKSKDDSYPAGQISLTEDAVIMFVDENQMQKKFCFAVVQSPRHFYMHAESDQETIEWVYSLRMAVYYTTLKKVFNDPRNFLKGGSTKVIEKNGFLKKQGGAIKTMHKRFFLLKDAQLSYYKSEKDLEPIDTIDLTGSKIELNNKKKGEYGIMIHTAGRQYYLTAETGQIQQEWFAAFKSVCETMSEAQLIKQKSVQIHNLILNRMIHGKDKDALSANAAISSHSPLMWRSLSFHRSRPQFLGGAGDAVFPNQQPIQQQQQQQQQLGGSSNSLPSPSSIPSTSPLSGPAEEPVKSFEPISLRKRMSVMPAQKPESPASSPSLSPHQSLPEKIPPLLESSAMKRDDIILLRRASIVDDKPITPSKDSPRAMPPMPAAIIEKQQQQQQPIAAAAVDKPITLLRSQSAAVLSPSASGDSQALVNNSKPAIVRQASADNNAPIVLARAKPVAPVEEKPVAAAEVVEKQTPTPINVITPEKAAAASTPSTPVTVVSSKPAAVSEADERKEYLRRIQQQAEEIKKAEEAKRVKEEEETRKLKQQDEAVTLKRKTLEAPKKKQTVAKPGAEAGAQIQSLSSIELGGHEKSQVFAALGRRKKHSIINNHPAMDELLRKSFVLPRRPSRLEELDDSMEELDLLVLEEIDHVPRPRRKRPAPAPTPVIPAVVVVEEAPADNNNEEVGLESSVASTPAASTPIASSSSPVKDSDSKMSPQIHLTPPQDSEHSDEYNNEFISVNKIDTPLDENKTGDENQGEEASDVDAEVPAIVNSNNNTSDKVPEETATEEDEAGEEEEEEDDDDDALPVIVATIGENKTFGEEVVEESDDDDDDEEPELVINSVFTETIKDEKPVLQPEPTKAAKPVPIGDKTIKSRASMRTRNTKGKTMFRRMHMNVESFLESINVVLD